MRYFLFSLLLFSAFFSCEKRLIDYRNKYLGSYIFYVNTSFFDGSVVTDAEYEFDGSVYYDIKGSKSEILINYSENLDAKVNVNKNGDLSIISSTSSLTGKFYEKDSVCFAYYYTQGMVVGGNHIVTGIKQ